MKTATNYSRQQIWLHWLTAILVLLLLTLLAETIEGGWDKLEKSGVRSYSIGVLAHFVPGVLVLVLTFWRGIVRLFRGAPALPENEHPIAKKLAHLTHIALYLLLILVPVTGLVAWFGVSNLMAELHEIAQALMFIIIGLHTAAALVHHFILKTNVLRRMMKPDG